MDSAGDEKEGNLTSMVMISKLGHYVTKLPCLIASSVCISRASNFSHRG